MERRKFLQTSTTVIAGMVPSLDRMSSENQYSSAAVRKLFIHGGGYNKTFLNHVIRLTGKQTPKICFLPTATGDSPVSISTWFETTQGLDMKPFVQRSFINSATQLEPLENTLLNMDAIIVGGGNTLNMIAVWKAQGIDAILRKGYEAGIVMGGGSAGSICWFQSGTTDSRPSKITKVDALGWIPTSHCPHYDSEKTRRPIYHDMILKGEITPGYACDDQAALYFENEKLIKAVNSNPTSKAYYVDLVQGRIVEKELPMEELPKS